MQSTTNLTQLPQVITQSPRLVVSLRVSPKTLTQSCYKLKIHSRTKHFSYLKFLKRRSDVACFRSELWTNTKSKTLLTKLDFIGSPGRKNQLESVSSATERFRHSSTTTLTWRLETLSTLILVKWLEHIKVFTLGQSVSVVTFPVSRKHISFIERIHKHQRFMSLPARITRFYGLTFFTQMIQFG